MTNTWVPEQIKNFWFWIYFVAVIICVTVLKQEFKHSDIIKILCLVALIVLQFIYNSKVKYEREITWLNWILFIMLCFFTVAYISAKIKDYNFAAITLLSSFMLFLIVLISRLIMHLWKVKDIDNKKPIIKTIILIFIYVILAVNIIILFGSFFMLFNSSGSELKINNCNNNTSTLGLNDYMFFSGTVFYSSTFGDVIPSSYARGIVLFECCVSYIIHIILLGIAISYFNKDKHIQ